MNTRTWVDEELIAQHRDWVIVHLYWTKYLGWGVTFKRARAQASAHLALRIALWEAEEAYREEADLRG